VALELASELDAYGHRSRIVAVGRGHEGETVDDVPPLVGSVRQGPTVLLLAAWRLRRSLRRDDFDLILAHGGAALQVGVLGGGGLPVVNQLIMGMPLDRRGPVWHLWWRWLMRRCDAVVSLTDALTREVRDLGFRGAVELVPNARRTARFEGLDRQAEADRLRRDLGIGPGQHVIGFVGHLGRQKRPDLAVEVMSELSARGVPVHLVMAGKGPMASGVERLVAELGLEDRVHLLGHVDDVEHVLAGIDVMVLTSDDEGMPGVVIEAQMAGCPVVSFPVGGIHDLVVHGESGVVLDGHDPAAMAEVVAGLLDDPSRLARMSEAARVASSAFSMAAVVERYQGVLTAVAAATPGQA